MAAIFTVLLPVPSTVDATCQDVLFKQLIKLFFFTHSPTHREFLISSPFSPKSCVPETQLVINKISYSIFLIFAQNAL